ncbi:MAG: DUF2141 domain-containing protein [Spirochaetales bacterium]|nr:DUF2141 domain-containing protein [Spirochaetales bacterium]
MKRSRILFYLMIMLVFLAPFQLQAAGPEFSISGTIRFREDYPLTIEIINEEEYDQNLASKYSSVITPYETDKKNNMLDFRIDGIPAGKYVVKVYQDLNGNGKFDFALIGGEPLATYKKPGFTLGRPSFRKLAFTLNEDLENIVIEL